MIHQLINDEKFTNIQKAQSGLTKLFLEAQKSSSFYRVLKNNEPLGVLFPESLWESLTEDIEALSSVNFRRKIKEARSSEKRVSGEKVKKMLNL